MKLPELRRPTVLSFYETSGRMVRPWLEAGYDAIIIDLLNEDVSATTGKGELHSLRADLADDVVRQQLTYWLYEHGDRIEFVFGFPPCTDLARSGARWFAHKSATAIALGSPDPYDVAMDMVDLVRRMAALADSSWLIENPPGRISTHPAYPWFRKPNFWYSPYEYAGWLDKNFDEERYSKYTGIWGSPDVIKPETRDLGVHEDPRIGTKIHWMPPVVKGRPRAYWRSLTPIGFARAFFATHHRPEALAS